MIANPGKFYLGAALLAAFAVVLVLLFLPLLDGRTPMIYLDSLYNSISKHSAYHISELKAEVAGQDSRAIDLSLAMDDEAAAAEAAIIIGASGVAVHVEGAVLRISGDLAQVLTACLDDADLMFVNDGASIEAKYGIEGRQTLFRWWQALKQMDKGLKRQSRFDDAKQIASVSAKGLESAYNYYGIEPVRISSKLWVVIFSLAFYVLYTVWYGYAIIFIFEGFGLNLSH